MASLGIDKIKPRTESNSIDYDTDNLTPLEILNKIKYALKETEKRLAEFSQKEDIQDVVNANNLSDSRLDTLQNIIDARTLQTEYDALLLRQNKTNSEIGDLSDLETYNEDRTIVNSDLVSAISEIDRVIREKGTAADKEIFETEQEIGKWIDGKKLYRYITRYNTSDMTNNPNSLTLNQIAINSSVVGCYTNKHITCINYYEGDLPEFLSDSGNTIVSYDIRKSHEKLSSINRNYWYQTGRGNVSSYCRNTSSFYIYGTIYPYIDRDRNKIIFINTNIETNVNNYYVANYEVVYYYTKDE